MLLSAEGGEHGFSLVSWLLHAVGVHSKFADSNTPVIIAGAISLALIFLALHVGRKTAVTNQCIVPDKKPSATNFFDAAVDGLLGMMEDAIGPDARRHLPLIGTVFFYILFSNLIGLVPGMTPPTSDINTNLAIGASVYLYYNYQGIKAHGVWHYLKHFWGPVWWIGPLLFVIELVSHLARPFTLSLRLFGNMTADHAVLDAFTQMFPIGVPIVFLALGMFVCLVQAFVFALLTIVYIALATAHDEGDGDHSHAHTTDAPAHGA